MQYIVNDALYNPGAFQIGILIMFAHYVLENGVISEWYTRYLS